jgi:hypothetical protein
MYDAAHLFFVEVKQGTCNRVIHEGKVYRVRA